MYPEFYPEIAATRQGCRSLGTLWPGDGQGLDPSTGRGSDLDREHVDPDEGVGAGIQRTFAERGDLGVKVRGHLADLRAR